MVFALPDLIIFGECNNLRYFLIGFRCAILKDKNHRKKAYGGIELIGQSFVIPLFMFFRKKGDSRIFRFNRCGIWWL
jgi:hypothetical protein